MDNMNSCGSKLVLPDRISRADEIPQTDKMIPISQLLDDKGQEIPAHLKANLTNGKICAVVVDIDGKNLFLQPQMMNGEEVSVPSNAHFVRDESTQEPLWRLATVAGGSI
tara:strand:+ start:412 stop:741 length:330 start_codon:yes stop_codon:yes gene_type:complete